MANMTEIRSRMKSIQETMKITNAMYLISSTKLRKAREKLDATAPYFELLQSCLLYTSKRDTKRAVMRFNPVLKKYKKDVDFCAPVQYNKSCL